MKTKICTLLIGLLVMGIPVLSVAQTAAIMYQPLKYNESPDGDVLEDSKSVKPSINFWIVCSDRNNNVVYNTPGGDPSSQIATLNFMDKFYVTSEQGEFLELYRYEEGIKAEGSSRKNLLNKKAKRVGWVKKDNLLLWFKCLENKTTHFSEKALTVVNDKNVSRTGQFVNKNSDVKIFSNPDLQKENNNTVKMFQFLYVYKREGSRVLIGKTHKTSFLRVDKDVLGWVDEDILQKWNNRVCLEPNYDADAAEKRKGSNIKASLFFDKDEAKSWNEGSGTPKAVWDDDTYDQRWPASKKRLPILQQDGDLVKTGFETPLFNENHVVVATVDQKVKMVKSSNEITSDFRKVNIVFVVDAGAGMDKYISAIKASLQKLVDKNNEYFKQGAEKNTYRYGAVVYRSLEDKTCSKGDLSLKKINLTLTSKDVINFLDKELQTEGCNESSLNRDVNGALGEALKMIKTANLSSIQSNYVLFIGSATGNKMPELKVTPDMVANLNVNLSVFQVFNPSQDEFSNFSTNFIDLIRECKKRKFALSKKNIKGNSSIQEPEFKEIGDGVQNLYRLDFPEKSPLQGSLCFPEKNSSISAETIDNVLDTSFSYFTKSLEDVLATANTAVSGVGDKKLNNFSAAVQEYFQRVGMNMNDLGLASIFTGKNYQFFEPAWTSTKTGKLNEPVFKHVIYASEDDLNDMIDRFTSTQIDASSSDTREKVYDAYQALVITYFGKDSKINEEFKSKLTLDSVISKITGLPSRSKLLKEIKLEEIKDVNKVSEDQITEIQKAIADSIEKLTNAKKDVSGNMRDITDDGVFYWIPEDYLP